MSTTSIDEHATSEITSVSTAPGPSCLEPSTTMDGLPSRPPRKRCAPSQSTTTRSGSFLGSPPSGELIGSLAWRGRARVHGRAEGRRASLRGSGPEEALDVLLDARRLSRLDLPHHDRPRRAHVIF